MDTKDNKKLPPTFVSGRGILVSFVYAKPTIRIYSPHTPIFLSHKYTTAS